MSAWLVKHELVHRSWGFDYQAIDTLQIKPENWDSVVVILYAYGFFYAYGYNIYVPGVTMM